MLKILSVRCGLAALLVIWTLPCAAIESAPVPERRPPGVGAPQACLEESEVGFRRYRQEDAHHASDGMSGVSHDRVTIRWNNDGYPVDVYSGFFGILKVPGDFCMRYELRNVGNVEIEGAWWMDIKARFGTLQPSGGTYDARSITFDPVFSEPAPKETTTNLEAFRHAAVRPEAYLPMESRFVPPSEASSPRQGSLELRRFNVAELEEALGTEISQAFLENPDRIPNTFLGVIVPEEPFEAVSVKRQVEIGNVTFAAYSALERREDGVVEVTSGVDLNGYDGLLSAPYLIAASTVASGRVSQDPLSVDEAVDDTWQVLSKLTGSQLISLEAGRWTPFSETYSADTRIMVMVEYPVAIGTEAGGVDCFLAPFYAAVPIDFSLAECPVELPR